MSYGISGFTLGGNRVWPGGGTLRRADPGSVTGIRPAFWILHVDLDEFVAAVEVLRRPELRGKPVVVGGSDDPTQRRVVVITASYAAREYGIRSGMPLRVAGRLCPHAVFLRADPDAYADASVRVMATLRTFTEQVEVLGWDEAFLAAHTDEPAMLASSIRRAVVESTGLSCSVGIGDNTHRAKLATGFAKPAGVSQLTVDNWAEVMFARPVSALWGIGPKLTRHLGELGIGTVADLATADPQRLVERFGSTVGVRCWRLGQGDGETTLTTTPRTPRSRSRELTFSEDLTDPTEVTAQVVVLARQHAEEAAASRRSITRVEVKLRHPPYRTKLRSRTIRPPSNQVEAVERAALVALARFDRRRPVRLVGVRVEFGASVDK